jgi:hypothetical protein
MSMTLLEALELPDEFMSKDHLCGLCGQSGIIDTVGRMFSPAGVACGVKVPCICANGRAIKRGTEEHERKAAGKRKPKPPKLFWVSWEDDSWQDPKTPGKRIIGFWGSGQAFDGSYSTIVAMVAASTTSEVIAAIDRDWPCEGERRWRFISPRDLKTFSTGDRFPLPKWAQKRLAKLKAAK